MVFYCSVPGCSNRGSCFKFPKDKKFLKEWVVAIKRVDPILKGLWKPGINNRVCKEHFKAEDFKTTLTGVLYFIKILDLTKLVDAHIK